MLAAERRRKEPRSLPRPGAEKSAPSSGLSGTTDTGLQARGLAGMLAATEALGAARSHA